ncbi:MAG: fibrobacter succinogenes major paralogous domain-containing protein [Candidatus Neomarinimicrobiota bacterium]
MKRFFFWYVPTILVVNLSAQSITNVLARQEGVEIVVTYDYTESLSDEMITFGYTNDGGKTWRQIIDATGDIGKNLPAGNGKTIRWTFSPELADQTVWFKVSTHETGTVTDIEGNVYQTIKIGNQWWMAENLKVTHYRNGNAIPNITDRLWNVNPDKRWSNLNTGAYCNYANDVNNVTTYGRLYNWYAIKDNRNIAPTGWHVPTDTEWQILVDYLGGYAVAGGKMKEAGTTHWNSPNTGATNASGFFALPGGDRYGVGNYSDIGYYAGFWSSTESNSSHTWSRYLNYSYSDVGRNGYGGQDGFSVRCVGD